MLKDAFIEYNANLTPQDRQYLHSRGLIDETINKELIGYAGSNGSLANLVKKYPFEELQKTGLFFVSKNGSLTEFYQRRFVFPYWRNGQIVYSIGRLDTDVPSEIARLPEWNQGKYIKQLTNSKKHPYVSECIQNVIWNADMAQQTQTGVIAEGIIDGLLFKQEMTHRFKQGVISPVTTKFRKQDIESLSKICNHWKIVYLIPDAEESEEGMKGAITTAEQLYEKGITKVCIVEIPCPSNVDKVDLADILNKTDRDKACEDLKALMDNAKDYLSLQIENARTLPDVEKDEAIRKIVKCLRRVDETSYMYQRYVSALAEKPALVQKGRLPLLITKAKEEEARKENINVPVSETEITNALLERKFIMDGNLALFYYRQDWYKWNGKYYKLLSTPNMRAYVAHFIKHETDAEVTSWTVGNVLEELQGECTIYDDIETPAWVRGPFDAEHAGHILVFENGWLDFGAFLNDKEVELNPHTPLLFATYALPFSFDPDASCPKWLTFLDYNLEGDSARIAILQEFLGYCLIWHTGLHKFLILEGEAGTGKSTVTKVFTAVLGWENVSHVPLEMFGERFGLYPTLGKLANIVGEVGELDSVAEAQLKAFVGGDPMMFDRKHKDPIEAAPTARLILATNNRPRFIDRSEGIWRRLMLIPFNRKVPEEKIIMDFDKQIINEELAGVFMWAFEGLYRLLKNGRFTTSELVEKEIAEYKLEGNPAKAFLLDYYEEGAGEVIIAEIYHEYKTWCEEMGFSPLNSANFGKEVFRVFPKVERKPKKENGKFLRVYTGLVPKR
jgi:P4 family phage/plasmid primase-like protien